MSDLPNEIQVWRSMDTLDHIGTWATTRFPAEAVTYVRKEDAKAAPAMVVEMAADILHNACTRTDAEDQLRALADADGLAMVQELRAERDGARKANREMVLKVLASSSQAQEAYEAQLKAEADRDRLAAEKAELEAGVERVLSKRFRATVKHDGTEVGDLPWLEEFWAVRLDDVRALSTLTQTPSRDLRENGHTPHEFYGSARTGCRECGHGQDHPIHTNRAAGPDTPTPSDTDGPIWHERLGWDGNKEGEG